ncbi:hypothetical protein HME9302_00136 [Alteripontixanthobacter maritimus]|uniref:LRAT domain-containing protein n=1 Tax=Alteripontixanthobacter maritimus TaxID=2161824 RepID=A0A369Q3C2_9SPHN|nr:hypothetical protein [Alteripontixanthobacter maritimus]RDC58960.1 hypothetical protein HME9302_00136 [Alteripontixanthobacter maritimus]
MTRLLPILLALLAATFPAAASAEVRMSFHSFNGSVLFGRYPHTFIVLEGTLDETGEVVNENYGFSAKRATTAVLRGPVEHEIMIEKPKYLTSTNRHFTVPLTDAQYRRVIAEMEAWRDAPGKYYSLDTRNCIHFVGTMAQIAGLKVNYPKKMLRKPKKWLNHISALNPQLGAKRIK